MILISFIIWFCRDYLPQIKSIIKNRTKRLNYPFAKEIVLLLLVSLLGAGVANFNLSALGIWKAYFLEPILLYLLIFNVFKTKQDLLKILGAFSLSAIGIAGFAVFQKITGSYIDNPFWAAEASRRVVSVFGYPNALGLYLAPLIMLLGGWLLSWQASDKLVIFKRLAIGSVMAISLLAIYFAHSEGALLAIVGSLLIFGLLSGRRERWIITAALIITIGGVFWFAPTNNFVVQKLALQDLSGQIRQQQWKETVKMLGQGHYFFGTGLNQYPIAVAPYHQAGIFFNRDHLANFGTLTYASSTLRAKYWQPVEIYQYPHNIILNFWTELGLLGLLLFIWLIVKYLIINYRLYRYLKNQPDRYLILGLIGAMTAIIIQGLVDVPYFKNDLSAMFWLFFALSGAVNIYYRSKS
jgi:O-antigen ligase